MSVERRYLALLAQISGGLTNVTCSAMMFFVIVDEIRQELDDRRRPWKIL